MKIHNETQICSGNEGNRLCVTCWRHLLWLSQDDPDEETLIGYMPNVVGGCENYIRKEYYGG